MVSGWSSITEVADDMVAVLSILLPSGRPLTSDVWTAPVIPVRFPALSTYSMSVVGPVRVYRVEHAVPASLSQPQDITTHHSAPKLTRLLPFWQPDKTLSRFLENVRCISFFGDRIRAYCDVPQTG